MNIELLTDIIQGLGAVYVVGIVSLWLARKAVNGYVDRERNPPHR